MKWHHETLSSLSFCLTFKVSLKSHMFVKCFVNKKTCSNKIKHKIEKKIQEIFLKKTFRKYFLQIFVKVSQFRQSFTVSLKLHNYFKASHPRQSFTASSNFDIFFLSKLTLLALPFSQPMYAHSVHLAIL